MTSAVDDAYQRAVEEGKERLERPLVSLLATGAVGGLDVSMGVFALFIVESATANRLLGALAFGIGFLALTLASSELFTENFLVPLTAVVENEAPWWAVPRLWAGTAVFNLVGGWVAMGLVMTGFPLLHQTAIEAGTQSVALGIGRQSFASAVIAGAAITLMTWMERATESMPAKVASALAIAFVLAAAPLQHAIVISVEIFAALHAGAPFGYVDWLKTFAWAVLGNVIGGVGLVTTLRIVQARGGGPRPGDG